MIVADYDQVPTKLRLREVAFHPIMPILDPNLRDNHRLRGRTDSRCVCRGMSAAKADPTGPETLLSLAAGGTPDTPKHPLS